jgi:hypothetical protein
MRFTIIAMRTAHRVACIGLVRLLAAIVMFALSIRLPANPSPGLKVFPDAWP